jgi:hypothetical protein
VQASHTLAHPMCCADVLCRCAVVLAVVLAVPKLKLTLLLHCAAHTHTHTKGGDSPQVLPLLCLLPVCLNVTPASLLGC